MDPSISAQASTEKETPTTSQTGWLIIQRTVGREGKDGVTLFLGGRPIGRIVLTEIEPGGQRARLGFSLHPAIRIVRDDQIGKTSLNGNGNGDG